MPALDEKPTPRARKSPARSRAGAATVVPATPTQARAVTTRDAILRSATKMFSKHGFAGASVEAISKMARTHDRMIYYYFGSKEMLYVEVLETVYQRMVDAEAALEFDLAHPVQALATVVRFTWQYYLDHPDFLALLNSENLYQGRHVKKSQRARTLSSPSVRILEQILEAGVAKRLFRPEVRASDLYIAIASLGYFYQSNRYTLGVFLGVDLMSAGALEHWLGYITDVVLRSVLLAPDAS
ncbi:MAG: TetR family transcriptional regulator [Paucimonas sp.]|nr:TetR family transcriptional regulator [Paucimonas sp.]